MLRIHTVILVATAVVTVACIVSGQSPEEAMAEFYSYQGAEDTLMDPLIVAGPSVYPYVLEAVSDPAMPRRRYAISFLGNQEVAEAMPALRAILANKEELPYFRGDALAAIYKIDSTLAKELAEPFRDEESTLGRYATYVLEDAPFLQERRSLEKAKRRWHD